MSLFTKQIVHCGTCGACLEQVISSGPRGTMVPRMAFCGDQCRETMIKRYTASILGKPQPTEPVVPPKTT